MNSAPSLGSDAAELDTTLSERFASSLGDQVDLRTRSRRAARGNFVCDAVRNGIREGKLCAGQRLREADLAEWLGVSRTPVREALKMLEAQGLVSSASGDGLIIATLTPQEVAELYTAWSEMERIAARHAALHARPANIKVMQGICDQWSADLSAIELGRLNHQLHQAIYTSAHNIFLHRALNAIDDSLALLGLHTYSVPERRAEAGVEHLAIVNAIARRDPDAAAAAAFRHIETSEKLRFSLIGQIR